jgi:hypothetical protein
LSIFVLEKLQLLLRFPFKNSQLDASFCWHWHCVSPA